MIFLIFLSHFTIFDNPVLVKHKQIDVLIHIHRHKEHKVHHLNHHHMSKQDNDHQIMVIVQQFKLVLLLFLLLEIFYVQLLVVQQLLLVQLLLMELLMGQWLLCLEPLGVQQLLMELLMGQWLLCLQPLWQLCVIPLINLVELCGVLVLVELIINVHVMYNILDILRNIIVMVVHFFRMIVIHFQKDYYDRA